MAMKLSNKIFRPLLMAFMSSAFVPLSCHSKNTTELPTQTVDSVEVTSVVSVSISDIEPEAASAWADSVIQTLTPRQRVAQLFVPRLDITDNAKGFQKLHDLVVNQRVGGFLLGKGSIKAYSSLINKAQKEAVVPLLVTLDGEWGLAMRVPGTPRFPSNIALGAANDELLMVEYGREVAMQCAELGIHVNFAPVLDVNSNPQNPVIGFRSFGEDPELVARLGTAYCLGLEEMGVMSVGKHFPGHGDTSVDSHKALPTVGHSLQTLKDVDFMPFVNAISSGMSGVMVGHLKVPALDKSGTPASLSKTITTTWLQDSLQFNGLIFTDALAMKGAAVENQNNCVSAFLAGADVLLGSATPDLDIQAVADAVKAGKISQDEVDRRCRKVLEYKYKLGLDEPQSVDVADLAGRLNSAEAADIIKRMSEKAVTLVRDSTSAVPLGAGENTVVVSIGAPSDNEFVRQASQTDSVKALSVTKTAPLTAARLKQLSGASRLIVTLHSGAPWALKAFSQVCGYNPAVGVFFVNPFKLADNAKELGKIPLVVLAYDDLAPLQVAAAQALYGKIGFQGIMPANVPGVASMGQGLQTSPVQQ